LGYRFIAHEVPAKGMNASENRVSRLCSSQRIWLVFAKKRGLNRKAGPPVHDDLVQRCFTAKQPNELWLTDSVASLLPSRAPTGEGTLYLCAIKDLHSGRIVGYWIDSSDEDHPGRERLEQRGRVAGPGRHDRAPRSRQPVPVKEVRQSLTPQRFGRIHGPSRGLR